jgi:endonuclease/exonuclease/phosphatase family metal-dependent hydrolase
MSSIAPVRTGPRPVVATAATAAAPLRVLTINTHKGLAAWNRRFMLAELRDAVRSTAADVVFLQEVIGERAGPPREEGPHYEYLADRLWPQFAYGRNAVYPAGDHGNALLSKYPILRSNNHDTSFPGDEPRGLLHCVLGVPGWGDVHAVCVHFGLLESHRRRQLAALCKLLHEEVPATLPLLVAGDFNDWRRRADSILLRDCGLRSAFPGGGGALPRTFPARWPLLALDRIYVRDLDVRSARALSARPWPHLSDHLPLLAEVAP